MKISTRGRYALRFMLDLAKYSSVSTFISLQEIAGRQEISKKYLEQIVPILNKAGMLVANRGYLGGYRLVRQPAEYTVGEILRVTEGNLACVPCVFPEEYPCTRQDGCEMHQVWHGLYHVITDYLDHLTLQDILDQNSLSTLD